jgi:5-(carboxyamino)imidazole ribonucleotide synthase
MKLGILGGGQLGAMLARAALDLGLEPEVLDPGRDCPASRVAPTRTAGWDDPEALRELARCNVVTYEFESIPTAVVEGLADRVPVRPAPAALAAVGDRLAEKRLFRSLGIPTAEFRRVDDERSLRRAVAELGLPAVLKTRRQGYDGKGQAWLRTREDVAAAWRLLGGVPLVLEARVAFEREVSLLAARSADGAMRFWPPTENVHIDGILRLSRAPAPGVGEAALLRARSQVETLARKLDYVGVLAVEFFVTGDTWLANEAACRVHNSGHWTLEASATSQFHNHVRAVAGLGLGATGCLGPAAMINLVGRVPEAAYPVVGSGIHLHHYGKTPAAGRKLGHVTVCGQSLAEVDERVAGLVERFEDPALEVAWAEVDAAPRAGPPSRSDRRSSDGFRSDDAGAQSS